MKISKLHKKGDKSINEDGYVLNEQANVFAAIDGATGLDGVPGYIASQVVQESLLELNQANSLYQCMIQANKKLSEKMIDYYETNISKLPSSTMKEIPKRQRSTTGVAAIQIQESGSGFDYFHAGDCMIFLKYANEEIRAVTHDLIHQFDELAIDEMMKLREEKGNTVGWAQIRETVNPILLSNREKMNSKKGYGIIDGTEEAIAYMEYGSIPLNKVTAILLLSDGLLLPTAYEEAEGWMQTADLAFTRGLEGLLAEVELRENGDQQCIEYPRLKLRDDKTGILIEL